MNYTCTKHVCTMFAGRITFALIIRLPFSYDDGNTDLEPTEIRTKEEKLLFAICKNVKCHNYLVFIKLMASNVTNTQCLLRGALVVEHKRSHEYSNRNHCAALRRRTFWFRLIHFR